MSDRTFTLQDPPMTGRDVRDWQTWVKAELAGWGVEYPLKADGSYGAITRDATASVCHGFGLASAASAMRKGVTPELRTKLRHKRQTPAEKDRYRKRAGWRKDLAARFKHRDFASPLAVILSHAWGWHPGVHDGVDLICKPNAPIIALCRAKVIRADAGGWWGLGAPSDPAVRSRGDGIIVLRSLVDAGPFKRGLNFGYGHAEHPVVKAGETVEAGEVIGRAGFANAFHVHFMVNGRKDAKGVGDRDPWPFVAYASKG